MEKETKTILLQLGLRFLLFSSVVLFFIGTLMLRQNFSIWMHLDTYRPEIFIVDRFDSFAAGGTPKIYAIGYIDGKKIIYPLARINQKLSIGSRFPIWYSPVSSYTLLLRSPEESAINFQEHIPTIVRIFLIFNLPFIITFFLYLKYGRQ